MNPWINATVVKIKKWNNNLFSMLIDAQIDSFDAGQFNKLALYDKYRKKIQRAYSYVNAPSEKLLEFYITRIKNGKLTNNLYHLECGDNIFIKKKSFGFFTLNEIPNCQKLWMFATGAAIGPYLSILQEKKNLDRFQYIILIHAVRYHDDLSYLPLMKKLYEKYHGRLKIQTITSREKHTSSLTGRIPFLLDNGVIEKTIGLKINCQNSHVMLCGNPFMVKDTYIVLNKKKNMQKNLRRIPGHITTENYW